LLVVVAVAVENHLTVTEVVEAEVVQVVIDILLVLIVLLEQD
jgi:hypothetical protein